MQIDRIIDAMGGLLVEKYDGKSALFGSGFAAVIPLAPPEDTEEASQTKREALDRYVKDARGVSRREWTSIGELALWACSVKVDEPTDPQLILGVPFDRGLVVSVVRAMGLLLGKSTDAVYMELVRTMLVLRNGDGVDGSFLRITALGAAFVVAQLRTSEAGDDPFVIGPACSECEFASRVSGCIARTHLLRNGGDCFSPREPTPTPTPPVRVIEVRRPAPAPESPPASMSNWEPSAATLLTCRTCKHEVRDEAKAVLAVVDMAAK
jgi:hypothetical protein